MVARISFATSVSSPLAWLLAAKRANGAFANDIRSPAYVCSAARAATAVDVAAI